MGVKRFHLKINALRQRGARRCAPKRACTNSGEPQFGSVRSRAGRLERVAAGRQPTARTTTHKSNGTSDLGLQVANSCRDLPR